MGMVAVIKDNLKTIRQRYQPLIRAGLSPEFVAALMNGELLIPAEILRRKIETMLAGETGVSLKRCDCHAAGVRLELTLRKAGVRITLPMTVSVSGIAINNREQRVALCYSSAPPVGKNRLSKNMTTAAGYLLWRMAGITLAGHPLVVEAAMRQGQGRLVMDIGGLKALQPIKRTLPLMNMTVLDIVSINGAKHVDGGILLKCALSWQEVNVEHPTSNDE